MDKKRLDVLKRVGDEISNFIKSTQKIKRLNQLEQAKSYHSFRNILRIIVKDRISLGTEGALFSLDEFVEDLFPEGHLGWRETQDLLLFRIYENLHPWLINEKEIAKELAPMEEITEAEEV
jgi:CRISPR-associated protein Cst1